MEDRSCDEKGKVAEAGRTQLPGTESRCRKKARQLIGSTRGG
jgi:hypothetical protein